MLSIFLPYTPQCRLLGLQFRLTKVLRPVFCANFAERFARDAMVLVQVCKWLVSVEVCACVVEILCKSASLRKAKKKNYIYILLQAVAKLQTEIESICKRTKGNVIRSTQSANGRLSSSVLWQRTSVELVDGHLAISVQNFNHISLHSTSVLSFSLQSLWSKRRLSGTLNQKVTSEFMSFVSPALYDVLLRLASSAVSAVCTASDPPFIRKAPPTDPISRYVCTQCTAYRLCSLLTFRAACRTWTTRVSSNFHLLIVPQCLPHYPTWERLTQRWTDLKCGIQPTDQYHYTAVANRRPNPNWVSSIIDNLTN